MGRVAVLATSALNQSALDYQGNVERIIESIQKAKAAGARYLCGHEMNIVGYSCGDHYHERDTEMHAWEALATIMQHPACDNIMVDVGLPVMHKSVIYNCKLVFLNKKVLLIRPKMILANDGFMGYREARWFTEWTKVKEVEDYHLPPIITKMIGQTTVPFGDGIIATKDATVGYEICEELWNPESRHIPECLDGADIISNGLGSLEELGKPGIGYQMVQMATMKSGGCYLFANQKGCDGSQGYFPGDACIGLNGSIVAYSTLHTLEEVEVITASIDLESIRHYKASIRSRSLHAAKTRPFPTIDVDFSIANEDWWGTGIPSCTPLEPIIPSKEELMLQVPACWLWDYLRKSRRGGIILPLTGDVDSSATAAIVLSMCHLVVDAVTTGNDKVLEDVRRLVGKANYIPRDAKELCGLLVSTLYAETSTLTKPETREMVVELAQQIGSRHLNVNLDEAIHAIGKSFTSSFAVSSKSEEGLASQSLHSRLAMAAAYFFAESQSGVSSKNQEGNMIVLTSSSLDNIFRGSFTKYGSTSGDINLIGRFLEEDICKFLHLAKERLDLPVLGKISPQSDADKDIGTYGYLQSVEGCGPYSMFGRLWCMWKNEKTPGEVSENVKRFFRSYSQHRQKMSSGLTRTFYMPTSGPPDDVGPMFYSNAWKWQFQTIDEAVKEIERKSIKN